MKRNSILAPVNHSFYEASLGVRGMGKRLVLRRYRIQIQECSFSHANDEA